jgi:putative endonuclease
MKHRNQKQFGIEGEALVIDSLIKKGFSIIAQNYRQFTGEIDIIASKGTDLVFVEVKTRYNPLFDMTELISRTKQKKIIATAKWYCTQKGIINMTCRFDVALVAHNTIDNSTTITIIENAFIESLS